jgi:hypothetical protein
LHRFAFARDRVKRSRVELPPLSLSPAKIRTTGLCRLGHFYHRAALLPLAGALLFGLAGCKQEVQHAPDVWALVNGKEIKRDDVDKYYRTRVNPEGQQTFAGRSVIAQTGMCWYELINTTKFSWNGPRS